MHACDGQTDGRTDGQTNRILIARPRLHCMQRGKNETLEEMELAMHCHLKPPAAPVMLGFNCDSRDTSTTA